MTETAQAGLQNICEAAVRPVKVDILRDAKIRRRMNLRDADNTDTKRRIRGAFGCVMQFFRGCLCRLQDWTDWIDHLLAAPACFFAKFR